MSDNVQTISLTIKDAANAREGLLNDPPDWPDARDVDCAGVQLLVAAMRAGLDPPDDIRNHPQVRHLWDALFLTATLPLSR